MARHGSEKIRLLRRWRGQADVYYARYDRDSDTLTEVPPSPPSSEE